MPISTDNSYLTVAEADLLAADEAFIGTWLTQTTPTKEKLLMRATEVIDYNMFLGRQSELYQPLQFPRIGLPNPNWDNTTPLVVKKATFRTAVALITANPDSTTDDVSDKLEIWSPDVKIKFRHGVTKGIMPKSAMVILQPLLTNGGQIPVVRG